MTVIGLDLERDLLAALPIGIRREGVIAVRAQRHRAGGVAIGVGHRHGAVGIGPGKAQLHSIAIGIGPGHGAGNGAVARLVHRADGRSVGVDLGQRHRLTRHLAVTVIGLDLERDLLAALPIGIRREGVIAVRAQRHRAGGVAIGVGHRHGAVGIGPGKAQLHSIAIGIGPGHGAGNGAVARLVHRADGRSVGVDLGQRHRLTRHLAVTVIGLNLELNLLTTLPIRIGGESVTAIGGKGHRTGGMSLSIGHRQRSGGVRAGQAQLHRIAIGVGGGDGPADGAMGAIIGSGNGRRVGIDLGQGNGLESRAATTIGRLDLERDLLATLPIGIGREDVTVAIGR